MCSSNSNVCEKTPGEGKKLRNLYTVAVCLPIHKTGGPIRIQIKKIMCLAQPSATPFPSRDEPGVNHALIHHEGGYKHMTT